MRRKGLRPEWHPRDFTTPETGCPAGARAACANGDYLSDFRPDTDGIRIRLEKIPRPRANVA